MLRRADTIPWTEKYRPRTIDALTQQDGVVRSLRSTLVGAQGHVPHMLFHGPPGTGKTTAILAVAHQWFPHPRLFAERVLELNASEDRGVERVRTTVRNFARTAVDDKFTYRDADGKRHTMCVPPFRLMILDEVDMMTHDAKGALLRIIEDNARTTRFCLICNYVTTLRGPLVSRCCKFRFTPLDDDGVAERLQYVARAEQVMTVLSATVYGDIARHCRGDLRAALQMLQCVAEIALHAARQALQRATSVSTSALPGDVSSSSSSGSSTTASANVAEPTSEATVRVQQNIVAQLTGCAPAPHIERLADVLVADDATFVARERSRAVRDLPTADISASRERAWNEQVRSTLDTRGYMAACVLHQLGEEILRRAASDPQLSLLAAHYLERIARADAALADGADSFLQVASIFQVRPLSMYSSI